MLSKRSYICAVVSCVLSCATVDPASAQCDPLCWSNSGSGDNGKRSIDVMVLYTAKARDYFLAPPVIMRMPRGHVHR